LVAFQLSATLSCRGALFFGPSFKVTRNKLTFRDNLPSLLAGAQTTERKLDKKFREWLMECHTLDRTIRYEHLLPEAEQVGHCGKHHCGGVAAAPGVSSLHASLHGPAVDAAGVF
jgi:hypothetical protein